MAKKRVKRRKKLDGMEVLASVADGQTKAKKVRRKAKPKTSRKDSCGVCLERDVEVSYEDYYDTTGGTWTEAPEDVRTRNVCVGCAPWMIGRGLLARGILREVERRLVKKARGAKRDAVLSAKVAGAIRDKGEALSDKFTSPDVQPDGPEDAELVRWGKRLDLESRWLEARA